jgi:hypothetical protein
MAPTVIWDISERCQNLHRGPDAERDPLGNRHDRQVVVG